MAQPVPVQIIVEAAFGSYPNDASYTWKKIHDTDEVSTVRQAYVSGLAWQRGLDDLIVGRTETGTGRILIRNGDRAWDPANTASPFYPNITPDLPVRAYAKIAGVTYQLFQHFMSGFPQKRIGPNYAEVDIATVDGLGGLALASASQPDRAALTITPTDVNSAITYTAVNPGVAGRAISIEYYQAHVPATPVLITTTDKAIRVRIRNATTFNTATQIASAVNGDAAASALVTASLVGDGSSGFNNEVAPTFLTGGDTASFPEELSGARISRCLDQAEWPAGLRTISAGIYQVAAASFAVSDTGTLLNHMIQVAGEAGEFGLLFVDANGKMVFLDQDDLYSSASQAVMSATFSDQPGFFVPYVDSEMNYDRDHVLNEWVGNRSGADAIIVQDTDSITKHRRSSHSVSTFRITDNDVQASMEFGRDEYGQPVQRLARLAVRPGYSQTLWAKCLGLELGSRVRVLQHPAGGGAAIDHNYTVIKLAGKLDRGPLSSAEFTFGLWPIRIGNYFVFDDATYDILDNTVLSY